MPNGPFDPPIAVCDALGELHTYSDMGKLDSRYPMAKLQPIEVTSTFGMVLVAYAGGYWDQADSA